MLLILKYKNFFGFIANFIIWWKYTCWKATWQKTTTTNGTIQHLNNNNNKKKLHCLTKCEKHSWMYFARHTSALITPRRQRGREECRGCQARSGSLYRGSLLAMRSLRTWLQPTYVQSSSNLKHPLHSMTLQFSLSLFRKCSARVKHIKWKNKVWGVTEKGGFREIFLKKVS